MTINEAHNIYDAIAYTVTMFNQPEDPFEDTVDWDALTNYVNEATDAIFTNYVENILGITEFSEI